MREAAAIVLAIRIRCLYSVKSENRLGRFYLKPGIPLFSTLRFPLSRSAKPRGSSFRPFRRRHAAGGRAKVVGFPPDKGVNLWMW
jgi:hypothetical protein